MLSPPPASPFREAFSSASSRSNLTVWASFCLRPKKKTYVKNTRSHAYEVDDTDNRNSGARDHLGLRTIGAGTRTPLPVQRLLSARRFARSGALRVRAPLRAGGRADRQLGLGRTE